MNFDQKTFSRQKVLFFFLFLLLSFNRTAVVFANEFAATVQMAVGNYTLDGANIVPSVLTSTNGGKTWSYTINHKKFLPPNINGRSAIFNSVSCASEKICVAVGDYSTKSGTFPILAVTKNQGHKWVYKMTDTLLLPPNSAPNPNVSFNSVSCSRNLCAAVGQYYNTAGMIHAMLLVSKDFGEHWEYKMYDTLLPPPHGSQNPNVYFRSVSCHHDICAAVGEYYNYTGFFPMLVMSTDAGNTWEYKISDYQLPFNHVSGDPHTKFRSVSCNHNVCAAVGDYTNGVGYFPILVASNDGGRTWVSKLSDEEIINNSPLIIPSNPAFAFTNVVCRKKLCVAAGSYNGRTGRFPIVLTSTDRGAQWSYKLWDQTPVPNGGIDPNAYVQGIDCSKEICAIGGSYRNGRSGDGVGYFPFILVSTDHGNKWGYKVFDTKQAPPNARIDPSGSFRSIKCYKSNCTAIGDYMHASSLNTFPMVATSSSHGEIWTYKVDDTHFFPPEVSSNNFDGILASVTAK